jgi:hypothetical protein
MRSVWADARAIALLVLVGLVVTACGTTVPQDQQQAAEAADSELGGDLGSTLPPGAHVNDKGQVVSAEGEVLGSAEDFGLDPNSDGGAVGVGGTDTTDAGNSGLAGGGGGSSGVAASAPGVTDSKIYIGIPYDEAGPANQAAFGASLDSDARKPYNAVIAQINKQGGLFGRQIEPIYFKFDGASSQTADQQMQAACSHWTEDNEVFAIFFAQDIIQRCAERAGAVITYSDGASLPEDFETYPHYWETGGLNLIRIGPVTVNGLYRENYFGKKAKVGVVTWDDPTYRASFERGYLPALNQRGIELATDPAFITPPQTAQDLGATSADVNSAVLRFQTQGITHVVMIDGPSGLCQSACMGTLFLRRADSQEYFPRYGFNANNVAKDAQEEGLYPARQLRDSIVVEWSDADKFYDEGYKINQTRERCYALMRKSGVPMDNANAQFEARLACEQLWFFQLLESILGKAPLTADNIIVAVNKVGSSFQSPSAYAVNLSASQHDGISAARNMKFMDQCTCYKWVSDPYKV